MRMSGREKQCIELETKTQGLLEHLSPLSFRRQAARAEAALTARVGEMALGSQKGLERQSLASQ